MKIAVVFNSPGAQVFQHRGPISQEVYTNRNINRIAEGLQLAGHEVTWLNADRSLIDRLEGFFGPLRDDEWPGLVFNIAFGYQGHLRYCHLPSMLEMLGLPYLGSGPLGHALSTDKAVAKTIFHHHGLPTPDFTVLHSPDFPEPGLGYPVIAKPVQGASSLGLSLAHNIAELRTAAEENLKQFCEPVLVEQFVGGRELNVSILGNQPPQALPVVEVILGKGGPPVYAAEDKHGWAERKLQLVCPAPIPDTLAERAQQLALKAFAALDCRDWARVEMRIDDAGQLQLLEVNTIPGISPTASFPVAAKQAGIEDLPSLVQRLVDVAVERYRTDPCFAVRAGDSPNMTHYGVSLRK